jgi:hypothetical protein
MFDGGHHMAQHLNAPTAGLIESVVVTWHNKDGTLRRMHVDTRRARGIIWRYDPQRKDKPWDAFTGKTLAFPRLDGTTVEMLGHRDKPKIRQPNSDGDVFCWWDESEGEWICPPEPEP